MKRKKRQPGRAAARRNAAPLAIAGALILAAGWFLFSAFYRPGGARQWSSPPEMRIDPAKRYTAALRTERGDIVVELLPQAAPVTVNSFVFLAREGYYDGVTFHRVLPGFVAQGGDPTGTGKGGPGYLIPNETAAGLTFDGPGVVAMANSGVDQNGSQFFITYSAQPGLDGNFTIFGRVLSGLDVVNALTPRDPAQDPDAPPGDKILSVQITEE